LTGIGHGGGGYVLVQAPDSVNTVELMELLIVHVVGARSKKSSVNPKLVFKFRLIEILTTFTPMISPECFFASQRW
jgi:hypothetical protein